MTAASAVCAVFAASVRRERKARDWTQGDLALRAGLSVTTIVMIENQRTGPSLAVAALIAGALGMTLGSLTDGEAGRG